MKTVSKMTDIPFVFVFALVIVLTRLTMAVTLGYREDQFSTSYDQDISSDGVGQNVSIQSNNVSFPYQKDILPRDVLPQKYHLWMKPNTDGKTDFSGKVTMELKCVKSTKYIILHSNGLNITNYRLIKKGSSQPIVVISMKTNLKNDQLLFEPKTPLDSGEKYELFIAFHGHMKDADIKANTKVNGFFRRSYFKKDGTRK